jgi:hypothetical protein
MPYQRRQEISVPPTRASATSIPRVSVVLISDGTLDELEGALAWLVKPCQAIPAELIAVTASNEDVGVGLDVDWPSVIFADLPRSASLFEMRQRGLAAATGDVVTLRLVSAGRDVNWSRDLRRLARLPMVPIDEAEIESETAIVAEGRGSRRKAGDLAPRRERRSELGDAASDASFRA